jgi:hypothetical protein
MQTNEGVRIGAQTYFLKSIEAARIFGQHLVLAWMAFALRNARAIMGHIWSDEPMKGTDLWSALE